MSFPSSPSNNQVVVVNNITYEYNSTSHTWTRVQVPVSANLIGANNIVVSNALTGGNVYATAFYWANGTPFASSTYGNTDVAAYLPTYTGNLTPGNVSAGGYYWANGAPFASSSYGNVDVDAYLPIYTGDITANNITTTGNIVGGGVRNTAGTTAPANPFPGDTWYDTDNDTLLRYTNDGDSYQWIDISGIMVGEIPSTYGNTQVATYLLYHTGNIAAGNVLATGYFWANGTPFASSTYSNTDVAAYLPTSSIITGINANVAGANAAIVTANSAVVSYVNTLNSAMASNVAGANAAIVTANTAMKSYVDGQVIASGGYSNVAMTSYLATNDITVANITGGGVRSTSSNTPPSTPSVGDIWFSTTEDRIYRYTSDGTSRAWLDITGSIYTFDMTGEMAITGNIIPTSNVTYSLGNDAYRFKDLYLSGNTIYLGNATLSESTITNSSNSARYKATMMAMVFGG